ncbi:MAG: ABC transporter ATP-binding protein [Clostridia bacterium]|nr:ABC transporter ATP-binding protein [Clostridia bacterium]MBQ8333969.1 ABC transporter ATP-binding protein [Clostridia bacterium]
MAGEVIVDLFQPRLMAEIVNTVVAVGAGNMEGADIVMQTILITALKMLGLVAIGGFMGLMCCYTASRASQGFGNDLRVDAFNKVMSLSLEQTDKFTTGSLVTRLTNDITTLQDLVQMILRMFVRAPIHFIGGLVMCLTLDISFGSVVLVALPFVIVIVLVMVLKAVPMFSVVQKKLDRVNSVVQETVTGARVIKAYTREEHEIERFDEANRDFQRTNLKVSYIMNAIWPILSIVMNVSVLAIIYIGGLQVEAAKIEVGDVMAAVQYITQVLGSIMMISMIFQNIARGNACAARVREVLEADQVIVSGSVENGTEKGTVRFENVSFKYPGAAGNNVLDNISFEVKKGETVAIIGATGSGKSSLVNLIPRFYDTVSGTVYVDGVDVKKWDLEALRAKIGFVLQKSELFSGGIDENIRWGKDDATMEEIQNAARIAQADEFISKMEDGYTSYVAEKGASLSGGQKQRVAISRAVLRHPEIIIFDDSTSALDLSTEAKLRKALNEEFEDTTVIMIAQRIASVMHADRIAVIENGKITAFDNHDNLMQSSAAYRDIYNSQMKNNGGDING